jgi:hypothetical protein
MDGTSSFPVFVSILVDADRDNDQSPSYSSSSSSSILPPPGSEDEDRSLRSVRTRTIQFLPHFLSPIKRIAQEDKLLGETFGHARAAVSGSPRMPLGSGYAGLG